ncbi:MAG: hypothetical protein ACLT98_12410 [Eggerthellaceae bacterium]
MQMLQASLILRIASRVRGCFEVPITRDSEYDGRTTRQAEGRLFAWVCRSDTGEMLAIVRREETKTA